MNGRPPSHLPAVVATLAFVTSAAAGPAEPAAAPASTRPASPALPLVYAGRGPPDPLTPGQAERVGREAAAFAPGGRAVWFALVGGNGWGADTSVTLYYAPDRSTPRLRSGLAVRASVRGDTVRPSEPFPYVQVSAAAVPFAGRPDAPAAADLPFEQPAGKGGAAAEVGDEAIVRLVDAA
ncbi:MAG: hypothetical protein JWO31_2470, partial [Phycisphaerales bacterium]|nr:hypothetical protein [Phycisphaerales bacterium]